MANYKDGIMDMAEINAEANRRYEQYLRRLSEENRQWRDMYGNIVDTIIDDKSAEEKQKLYGISTPDDIIDADRDVQELLIAILWELSLNYATPKDEGSKYIQELYVRSVQRHLGIMDIQSQKSTLACIKDIDSKKQERAVLQIVMEYLFLDNNSHDYIQKHASIISCFPSAADDLTIQQIQSNIDNYVRVAGVLGLAEKYSYKIAQIIKEEKTPARFKICIRYEKKNKDEAKRLTAFLENRKNSCDIIEIHDKAIGTFDYTIILGDNEYSKDTLSFGQQQTLFDSYGCTIVTPKDSDKLVAKYDDSFSGYNRDEFISFYQKTCCAEGTWATVNDSKAKDMVDKHAKEKPRKWRIWDTVSNVPDTIMEKLEVKDTDGIGKSLLKVFGMIASIPVSLAAFAVSFIVAIPEELVQDRIEKMKSSNFDKKFVGEAQSDILYIKLSEYIWNEQLKNAK